MIYLHSLFAVQQKYWNAFNCRRHEESVMFLFVMGNRMLFINFIIYALQNIQARPYFQYHTLQLRIKHNSKSMFTTAQREIPLISQLQNSWKKWVASSRKLWVKEDCTFEYPEQTLLKPDKYNFAPPPRKYFCMPCRRVHVLRRIIHNSWNEQA
jgi:hypothetical protein